MIAKIILFLGIILAIGYGIGKTTHFLYLTGVVGYILLGILLGPSGIDIISRLGLTQEIFHSLWDLSVDIALGFIALQIGLELSRRLFREFGALIIAITLGAALFTSLVVFAGIYAYTADLELGVLLGALAAATAPAGTVAVIQDYRTKGPVTSTLIAIVGLDDALTIMIFAFALAAVKALAGDGGTVSHLILLPFREIFGGLALGTIIGALFLFVSKIMRERQIKLRESELILSLASVTLAIGVAERLGFSPLLTCMMIGALFVNLLPSEGMSVRRTVEQIMPPIYVVFFTLAGMLLQVELLSALWIMSTLFILLRSLGKILGAVIPVRFMGAPQSLRHTGWGLLNQAGVAIGLAVFAGGELAGLPGGASLAERTFTVIMATSVIFTIVGPIGARYALDRAGEIGRA